MDQNSIERDVGSTTISLDVLHKIARLTTLSVNGVSRMAFQRGNVERLFRKDGYQGANVRLKNGRVFVEIYVVMMSDQNVRNVAREIQARVSRAISEMIGMEVGGVNIHIMDIHFGAEALQ